MLGMTGGNQRSDIIYQPWDYQGIHALTMYCESDLCCDISKFIHNHTAVGTSIRGLRANDG